MRSRYVGLDAAAMVEGPAVVVDVMRAFTTAAWALASGVEHILLVDDVDEALRLKAALPGTLAACDGRPGPGFDLANSPAQLARWMVRARALVLRTAAGTRGTVAARACSPLVCTGFVTVGATAAFLRREGVDEVTYVITGGDEDRACAEHLDQLLNGRQPSDRFVERALASEAAAELAKGARLGYRGVDERDVGLCVEVDRFDFAITARDEGGLLTLRATAH